MSLAGVMSEDAAPRIGIWYYLWLKPEWVLKAMPVKIGGPGIQHYKVWSVLAEEAAKHFNLNDEQLRVVARLPYSMPRGRVDYRDLKTGAAQRRFILYHGNDFPSTLDVAAETRRIIGEFNLTSQLLNHQNVGPQFDEHETMLIKQQEELRKVLGDIPY
ncbi:MAG: hypothetical protein Q8K86_08205 [Candidatus Nanopelagicaceae bacterium]|nr:hypothetical protein [Candidatus Nanopelagicaceae bacterium]